MEDYKNTSSRREFMYNTVCGLIGAAIGTSLSGCKNTGPKNPGIEGVVQKQYSTQEEEIRNSKNYYSETEKKYIIESYYMNPQETYTNLNPKSKKVVDNFDVNNLPKKSKERIKKMCPWINLDKLTLADKLLIIEERFTEPDF